MTDGGGQEVSDSKSDRNPLATSGLHDRKAVSYRVSAIAPSRAARGLVSRPVRRSRCPPAPRPRFERPAARRGRRGLSTEDCPSCFHVSVGPVHASRDTSRARASCATRGGGAASRGRAPSDARRRPGPPHRSPSSGVSMLDSRVNSAVATSGPGRVSREWLGCQAPVQQLPARA